MPDDREEFIEFVRTLLELNATGDISAADVVSEMLIWLTKHGREVDTP